MAPPKRFIDRFLKEATKAIPEDVKPDHWKDVLIKWISKDDEVLDILNKWKADELENATNYAELEELPLNDWSADKNRVSTLAQKPPPQAGATGSRRERWAAVVRDIVGKGEVPGQHNVMDKSYPYNIAAGVLYTALEELYYDRADNGKAKDGKAQNAKVKDGKVEGKKAQEGGWFLRELGKIKLQAHADGWKKYKDDEKKAAEKVEADQAELSEIRGKSLSGAPGLFPNLGKSKASPRKGKSTARSEDTASRVLGEAVGEVSTDEGKAKTGASKKGGKKKKKRKNRASKSKEPDEE